MRSKKMSNDYYELFESFESTFESSDDASIIGAETS